MKSYTCKKLGIDIDNTITSLELTLDEMAKYYDKIPPTVDDIKDFNLSTVYGITAEESKKFWMEREWYLIQNAEVAEIRFTNMLELFADKDTEIYIITNRPARYQFETAEWLERHAIQYKELHVVQESKTKLIQELELDVMIDDKPDLFYEVQTAKNNHERIKARMVCIDYEYNKHVPCDIRLDRDGRVLEYVY